MEGGRPVPTQTITEGDAGDGERAGLALVIQETEAQSRLAVLARLAPYRLVRHVIASREPIDHESYFDQTCCAALFIDISGFSKMTEKLVNKNGLEGAEQLARHLNINLGRIVDRLTQCGADVIKFAGDAALCIFPVVEGGPDLAAQTLRATQLSLECISALERENYIVEGIRLTAHSGLGCGEATGFFAGGAQPAHLANARTEYTPIGAPMTQIASSEPAAGDGETVVSPQCWALIGDQCEGRVVVDEKSHETNYLVTSIKPEFKINLDEGATGGITEELRALTEAEADMVADQIKVVVPEAVHAHLTDLQPGAIPTIAEFRSVTVLFSRLTGLDYSRGRSELQKVQRIVRLIQETIYKHAGQLMRFSVDDKGAVVLGVFGLPPSNQDDPERGVLAAMEYCKAITAGDFDGVRATVGITTGYCFSGLVGGVSRCEYTTHGPLVNLAARLMVASERDALVDTDTRDRCLSSGSLIEFDTMPPIKVKGREELVPIFVPRKVAKVKARVIARSASVAHMGERTSSGTSFGSSPKSPGRNTPKTPRGQRQRQQSREVVNRVVPSQKMIGRRQECELIRKVFMQVVLDADAAVSPTLPPLCVLAEGEAGIGKSELCREAMHYARGLEMDCFWTAGHADTISSPLRPFRCILRGLFNEEQKHAKLSAGASSGAEGGELVSEKFQKDRTITQLTNVFSSLDCPEDLRRHAGMFYTFVTAHPSEDAGSDLHAPTMVKLIVHWLAERCARHPPTLLVLDDAQWLDPTSWALCEILAASEKCRGRLLMVFASRPIPKHSMLARRTQFLRRSSSNHMELQPMTKPELIEIITKRLESESIESSSGGVFTPDSPARRRKTAGAGGSLDADEEEVPKLDSNEAIKQYMAQFSESCVHVGGLGNGQEEDEEVEELFGQFGTVYGASVRIREGANRSWGLVSFASQAQAEVVINSRIGLLDKIERGRMSHAQAMRSTGSLHLVYKQQMEKVQLRLQRTLLQTEAEKLTAGRQSAVLSKQDVQHLLGVVGVELSSLQLNSAMRQLDDSGDGIVAEISAFHDWWAANGSDLTATASASYRLPPEVEEVIKRHPSGSPLRMLLLAKEMVAGDQVAEEGVPQSPGSPRRPRRHTASDGSVLQTDEDTAAAISRMLRRLTPDEQHVLQLVAVCGADSSLRMIQTMQHEVDAMQSVSSKHVIDDRNIVPTFTQLAAKKILNYPGSLAVMFDTDGHVPHLLFAEKIVEEVVLASLKGTERHIFTLAGLQRYLFTPELHREQLARGYARTENGGDDAGRHLCSAALLAIEMQADCEAAQLCSEIVELPAMQGEDSETNRIRWLKRLAAARLRCGRDGRELAAALAPTVEALRLCEMTLPADKEGAAANTSLLLRGGQVAIPSPKPSKKPVVASAGKMRFKRLARKATQKNAGMSHVADAATAKKKSDMSAFHETTAEPRWMSLTELHLLLASSAQAAGMWALQNYATVAALRLLEARGQMQSGRVAAGGVGALALTNVGFGSSTAGAGGYSSLSGGERYQTEAEAALAARVHSAVAANARQLGVPEWAHEQRELAQGALDALASKTEAAAGLAANGGGRLPRELLEAEWEAHANLAYSHLACANLEDGTREYYASASYSHTVGVEECRREEALHAASWLVFWAKGPSQAHEWFGGDELAASAERRGDDLMLARILCGQALCEIHSRVDSQKASNGSLTLAGTSISECLDSAEERLNACMSAANDQAASSEAGGKGATLPETAAVKAGATAAVALVPPPLQLPAARRRTGVVSPQMLLNYASEPPGGGLLAAAAAAADGAGAGIGAGIGAGGGGGGLDDSQEAEGAQRAELADRLGLSVFIKGLRCLNMLWEATGSTGDAQEEEDEDEEEGGPDTALLAALRTLQPLATQVASQLLTLTRDYEEEAVLVRPEYVEGFGAVTTVLLEIGELRAKQGQLAAAGGLQLTAFHCALATERFSRLFIGAAPLAANLRAACARARSDPATARAAYTAAIAAAEETSMLPTDGHETTQGGGGGGGVRSSSLSAPKAAARMGGGEMEMPFAVEVGRAESGLASLALEAGDDVVEARRIFEQAERRLERAGSIVLARQVKRSKEAAI